LEANSGLRQHYALRGNPDMTIRSSKVNRQVFGGKQLRKPHGGIVKRSAIYNKREFEFYQLKYYLNRSEDLEIRIIKL